MGQTTGVKEAPPRTARKTTPRIEQDGEGPTLRVKLKKDSPLQRTVAAHYAQTYGYTELNSLEGWLPASQLARMYSRIEDALDADSPDARELKKIIVEVRNEQITQIQDNLSRGVIEFDDVPFVVQPGDHVVTHVAGKLVGGIVDGVTRQVTWAGPRYVVQLKVLANARGVVEFAVLTTVIPYFRGPHDVTSLPVHVPSPEELELLTRRGRKFASFVGRAASYLSYSGQIVRAGWWAVQSWRADGRVMIDAATFARVDSDQQSTELRKAGLDLTGDEDSEALPVAVEVTEENSWQCFPFVWGFSFTAKRWGRLSVDGLSMINWREDAFDKLVLDPKKKKLVKSLVENSSGSFTDIVDGKGGGVVFLLHGPPGQGKTLTAEAIAELLHRPLYAISIGELGVTPDTLEERLDQVLEIAMIWDAVVLLDEADIFLEARDHLDVLRNAMVGVFLRKLEYHQGVMFLTTNRVKEIDEAFYSRISVGLHYPSGGPEKNSQIWANLLATALPDVQIDVAVVALAEINGRQIKNVIRQAQTLAKTDDVPVTTTLLLDVIEQTTAFAKEMKELRGNG